MIIYRLYVQIVSIKHFAVLKFVTIYVKFVWLFETTYIIYATIVAYMLKDDL